MPLTINKVTSKSDLKKFIKFPFELYKGVPQYVPPIISFEESTFSKEKNPAFEHCDAELWLVFRDGKIVGRIAGIVHNTELAEKSLARFGWIDFIDDSIVFDALIKVVSDWALSKGATKIHGPMGFTDFDFEGTLIDGYEHLATQATIYNYPYYVNHFERVGFEKACDWIEIRSAKPIPQEIPKRLERKAEIISNRFKIKAKEFTKSKEYRKYGQDIFKALNDAYKDLYGFYPLTEKQITYYMDLYFSLLRQDLMTIVVDENDKVIGFALTIPSFSKAFQKAKGHLFPFGFLHVLKAFKWERSLDLLLIFAKPEYQKLGVSAIMFHELFKTCIENNIEHLATGPMLENNFNVRNLWTEFLEPDNYLEIRRRCFIKEITL